jgi:RHS repeat-associated protein
MELDAAGDLISYEEYYPFGTSSFQAGRSAVEVQAKRYRYVGKERDEHTGLDEYGARYYASWLCRFVSVDALKDKYPFYTTYQYAGNKPVSFIDLDGLEEEKKTRKSRKSFKEYSSQKSK